MSDDTAVNIALLAGRLAVGLVMLAHGYNHIWGGGKIAGTARWFGSLGMKPPRLHAWLASVAELGAGVALVAGFLTPFGGAGVVGTMLVAWIINHRKNGFFVFRPGEGWEYVMVLFFVGVMIGTVGPGEWSVDNAIGIRDSFSGLTGLLISAALGGAGGALLLAACWRPPRTAQT